ncbi:MAG: hypothetical protein ABR584_09380 [Candidatus Baltobacteraceae bacterium]
MNRTPLRNDVYRDRMNAASLARHGKLILHFAVTYGRHAIEALDDVLRTLPCGEGYEVNFTSPMYKDAWDLIQVVGPDAAGLIAPFVSAYQSRNSVHGWNS